MSDALKVCPFCGKPAVVEVIKPEFYGPTGARVQCTGCKARTRLFGISSMSVKGSSISTPITAESIARGVKDAVVAWDLRRGVEV